MLRFVMDQTPATSVKIRSGSYHPIPQAREHSFSKHWHKLTLNIFESLLKCPPLNPEVCSVSSICRATVSLLKPQIKPWWATRKAIELDAWSKGVPLQPEVVFEPLARFWLYHWDRVKVGSKQQSFSEQHNQLSKVLQTKQKQHKQHFHNTQWPCIYFSNEFGIYGLVPTTEPFP